MPRSAFPYVGGKTRLVEWIISQFPDYRCYITPFGGGAGVLLNKDLSPVEMDNDVDRDVVHFF